MSESLRVRTELVPGGCVATVLMPSITQFDTSPLESDLRAAASQGKWRMAIDMGAVEIMGSNGLGLLMNLRRDATTNKGKIVLFGLSPELLGVMKTTRLDKLLPIAKDKATALKELA